MSRSPTATSTGTSTAAASGAMMPGVNTEARTPGMASDPQGGGGLSLVAPSPRGQRCSAARSSQ